LAQAAFADLQLIRSKAVLFYLLKSSPETPCPGPMSSTIFILPWTVERIYRKKAVSIPTEMEFDSVGLGMGIWY
jgi:hypothetical protein